MRDRRSRDPRSGQTMMFMIMLLLIMALIVMWNFDLHKALTVKFREQNAGDAAALAAARWQGLSLNLIGDLNIMQATALMEGDTNAASAIAELQARVSYTGPMVALLASQQAAKLNGMHNNDEYTEFLLEHAEAVAFDYTSISGGGTMLFEEPWPGAWGEYADMLFYIAEQGVAVGPDNMVLYSDPAESGHYLMTIAFYDAVAGKNWCWFKNNAMDLLTTYTDWTWWPPLPDPPVTEPQNSEIFGLGIRKQGITEDLTNLVNTLMVDRELGTNGVTNVFPMTLEWYCYDEGAWQPWDILNGGSDFPQTGPLKPQYDYTGADAATRIDTSVDRITPGARASELRWTSAAKTFGYLNDIEPPDTYTLVLPAYHDVRLIPVDASSRPQGGSYNLAWREHTEVHLPSYVSSGLSGLHPACWYCNQLRVWERPEFRTEGITWINDNPGGCVSIGGIGGGGGGSGGTYTGH